MEKIINENPLSLCANTEEHLFKRLFFRFVEKLSGLEKLQAMYKKLSPSSDPDKFFNEIIDFLNITYETGGAEANIPEKGRVIIIANHPFGAIDGMILVQILLRIRPDVKVLANEALSRIPGVSNIIIPVNVFNNAITLNRSAMSDLVRWLENDGLLLVFPAGIVSHFQIRKGRVCDPEWNNFVSRIVVKTGSPVIPIYIHGRNSILFQLFGLLHPALRTFMLPRELMKKRGNQVNISIGKEISVNTLKRVGDHQDIMRYLRFYTEVLSGISSSEEKSDLSAREESRHVVVKQSTIKELYATEIKYLPEEQCLVKSGKMRVYYAHANQIPWTLQEIGRIRELTFRQIGEGTGNEIDISPYDSYYCQLFIWNEEEKEIIGGYRLGLVDEIMQKYGITGLYTHSLFNYKVNLLQRVSPMIELGRAFVRKEYQQSYLALNLLWQGIGSFVARHKKYAVLFGPVSISNDYDHLSRKFMIDCLKMNLTEEQLSTSIKPRNPYRSECKRTWDISDLSLFRDVSLVSSIVSQIEKDNKGIPVLFRQYIKLGGKFLCFNVDDNFSQVIDGLIMVDLRQTNRKMLDRYMGEENASGFMSYHQNRTAEKRPCR